MIALAAWWNISHAAVMAIQTVQAWSPGVHRNFSDVILFLVIGGVLLASAAKTRDSRARSRVTSAGPRFGAHPCSFARPGLWHTSRSQRISRKIARMRHMAAIAIQPPISILGTWKQLENPR
jgi:hypothetical protein